MVTRNELRREAYRYILQTLANMPEIVGNSWIPLEEIRLVKEGIEDPSPALVSLLKNMLDSAVSDVEIDSHLVRPFQNHLPD